MDEDIQRTPGPWEAQSTEASPRPDWRVIARAKRGRVATVYGSDGEANARLMAAAPELLEATRRLRMLGLGPGGSLMWPTTEDIEFAREAIAKAEGDL